MREKGKAVANIIIAGLLLANAILTAAGKNPIPFDESIITRTICYVAAGVDTVYIWWKNQNITVEAQTAQKIMESMKLDREKVGGEGDPLEVE